MNGKIDKGTERNEIITELPDDALADVKGGAREALGRGPRGKQGKRKDGGSAPITPSGTHVLKPQRRVEYDPDD